VRERRERETMNEGRRVEEEREKERAGGSE
jgi:hypothetical protein